MKKSNKLLISYFIALFILFNLTFLILSVEYKKYNNTNSIIPEEKIENREIP